MTSPLSPSAKLDAVRAWVTETCPELLSPSTAKILPRKIQALFFTKTIGIVPVLRTLQTVNTLYYVDTYGRIHRLDEQGRYSYWNLADDNLNHQSAELLDFLYSLIPNPL